MTRCLTLTMSVFALMCFGTIVRADVNEKVKACTSPKDSKEFAMKAAEGGMLEVKLSQLAEQKATSAEVKELAKRIERDHTAGNDELMAVAKQKNIMLPMDLRGECQETYEAFQKLEGQDFDNAYVLFLVKDHLKDIMMFQKEASNGTDADIKQWAAKTLPTLREHTGKVSMVAQGLGFPIDALANAGNGNGARPAHARIPGSETGTNGRDQVVPPTPRDQK
jgi:putative membrane protein